MFQFSFFTPPGTNPAVSGAGTFTTNTLQFGEGGPVIALSGEVNGMPITGFSGSVNTSPRTAELTLDFATGIKVMAIVKSRVNFFINAPNSKGASDVAGTIESTG
jgi:hypothetical protein